MDPAEIGKVKFKVGLFVIVSVLISAAALLSFAIKKDFFEKTHYFTLLSRSGEELHKGIPVVFSGFKIGVVSDLALDSNGHVEVTLKIPQRHAQWVRSDSTFTLEKPFIGESKIVLVSKNLASDAPPEGQFFTMGVVDDINEVIKRTRPIVDRLDRIAANIDTITCEDGLFYQSLSEIHRFTSELNKKHSLLEAATNDEQAVLALNQSLRQLPQLIEKHSELAVELHALLADTQRAALGPNGSVAQANRMMAEMSSRVHEVDLKQLNTLLSNAARISADLAQSTQDLQLLRQQLDESAARLNLVLKRVHGILPSASDADNPEALP